MGGEGGNREIVGILKGKLFLLVLSLTKAV